MNENKKIVEHGPTGLKRIPIGISDYRKLKTGDYYIVDKSLLIKEFLDSGAEVTLVTRPRRFGKTLNMSMMAEFFDITKDSKDIFKDTAIMDTEYIREMNQYPTIFLSFADAKGSQMRIVKCIKEQLLTAYRCNAHLLKDPDMFDKPKFDLIMKGLSSLDDGSLETIDQAIAYLMEKCHQYYGKKVMLIIDEYDTPFIEAHVGNVYSEIHSALAGLLSSALKDNPNLQNAMLTGIQRVAKENIFSGLNNPEVRTVSDKAYSQHFGFVKKEVDILLKYYGLECSDEVKAMYDGYNIGGTEIYNPWSILNYAKNHKLIPYWVNVSSNQLIKKAMEEIRKKPETHGEHKSGFETKYEELIEKKQVETVMDLQKCFYEESDTVSLWGLFVNAGYLTIKQEKSSTYLLEIPNNEVAEEFQRLTLNYLNKDYDIFTMMMRGLYDKEPNVFIENYRDFLLNSTSYHDLISENSYHTLLLGMCACLYADYEVKSNQEAGKGRYDIVLQSKTNKFPSYIIELKYLKKEDYDKHPKLLKEKCEEALRQIEMNRYDITLSGQIIHIALTHSGKDVEMLWKEA
ncbi:MAG: AAA family ATPase [[Clostridium] innocuum]